MKTLSIVFLVIMVSISAFATRLKTVDTIYYMVDIAKIPYNDRMVEIDTESYFRYYVIQCECLKYNKKPTFLYNYEKEKGEYISSLKKIHFISLKKLIELAKENGDDTFNNNHVAFFIEREGKQFVKHKVKLLKPHINEVTY